MRVKRLRVAFPPSVACARVFCNLVPRAFLRRGEDGRPSSPQRRKALGTRLVYFAGSFVSSVSRSY